MPKKTRSPGERRLWTTRTMRQLAPRQRGNAPPPTQPPLLGLPRPQPRHSCAQHYLAIHRPERDENTDVVEVGSDDENDFEAAPRPDQPRAGPAATHKAATSHHDDEEEDAIEDSDVGGNNAFLSFARPGKKPAPVAAPPKAAGGRPSRAAAAAASRRTARALKADNADSDELPTDGGEEQEAAPVQQKDARPARQQKQPVAQQRRPARAAAEKANKRLRRDSMEVDEASEDEDEEEEAADEESEEAAEGAFSEAEEEASGSSEDEEEEDGDEEEMEVDEEVKATRCGGRSTKGLRCGAACWGRRVGAAPAVRDSKDWGLDVAVTGMAPWRMRATALLTHPSNTGPPPTRAGPLAGAPALPPPLRRPPAPAHPGRALRGRRRALPVERLLWAATITTRRKRRAASRRPKSQPRAGTLW